MLLQFCPSLSHFTAWQNTAGKVFRTLFFPWKNIFFTFMITVLTNLPLDSLERMLFNLARPSGLGGPGILFLQPSVIDCKILKQHASCHINTSTYLMVVWSYLKFNTCVAIDIILTEFYLQICFKNCLEFFKTFDFSRTIQMSDFTSLIKSCRSLCQSLPSWFTCFRHHCLFTSRDI